METVVSERYPGINKALRALMKIVQRELEDGRLKAEVLTELVDLGDKINDDGKEGS